MRARFKAPSGTGVLELPNDATIQDVFDEIRAKTEISSFSLKFGPPMAMKTISAVDSPHPARSFGLHGETLTVVPDAARPEHPASLTEPQESSPGPGEKPEDAVVPWPEREGTLLLRVMPSDNSCLFTAFGGALPKQIPAPQLRRMMAEYIMEHPDVFSEAVLGSPPAQYCRSVVDPDRWGGGIELSILSTIFNIQIATFDVQAQNLINFGEDKRERCILVYSGIHYDRVAFTYASYPADLPPELDRTIWPVDDDDVITKTHELVQKLHDAHYYTDPSGLILKCDVPGCGWIGSGQVAGQRHAQETGHFELSEIRDLEEDNVLRSCDNPGCSFIGQGEVAARKHRDDTGHKHFSIIPDI